MKIINTQVNQNFNDISFGSKPLLSINLKRVVEKGGQKVDEFVPATFSLLEKNNTEDRKAINRLKSLWGENTLISQIAQEFQDKFSSCKFFCIELADNESKGKPLHQKILSVASVIPSKNKDYGNCLHVDLLQGSPINNYGKNSRVSGAGRLMLYGVAQITKLKNYNAVKLSSSNHEFYDAIKMPRIKDSLKRVFSGESLNQFIKETKQKYNM